MWTQAVEAKYENKGRRWTKEDFDQILGDYSACTDLPCAMFAEELMDAYPDAKVILNQRPIDAWYESVVNSVNRIQESWVMWFLMNLDHQTRTIRRCWIKTNGHAFEWDIRANAKRIYQEHGRTIRDRAPVGRFLEYDPNQGWEPLCQFLDVPIPEEPFPRGNVTQEFHKRIEGALKPRFERGLRNAALIVAAVVGFGVLVYLKRTEVLVKWR